jgi:hypothetical protein
MAHHGPTLFGLIAGAKSDHLYRLNFRTIPGAACWLPTELPPTKAVPLQTGFSVFLELKILVRLCTVIGENIPMKSAYELAMERLQKDAPSVPLNAEQRAQIAEIDSLYKAKIAEKELLLKGEIAQEQAKGKFDQVEQLQKQLASELRRLNEEREEKKEKVRQGKA